MGKFSAAKLTGGTDVKAQTAHNYLIDLLESGYVSNALIEGNRVRVDVNPQGGFTISSNDVVIGGIIPINGTIFNVSGAITNDATDPNCWAMIGEQTIGVTNYRGITLFNTDYSSTEAAMGIRTDAYGSFIVTDGNATPRISANVIGMFLYDETGELRFIAQASGTFILNAAGQTTIFTGVDHTTIQAPGNSQNYIVLDSTGISFYINDILKEKWS